MSECKVAVCGLCGMENRPEFCKSNSFRAYYFYNGVKEEDGNILSSTEKFILCPNCQVKVLRILQGKM